MRIKQIIKNRQLLESGAVDGECTLLGEPLIYSIKFDISNRTRGMNVFRNKKWASMIKCYFRAFYQANKPVVLIIKFYVSPPSYTKNQPTKKELSSDKAPAVYSFELCDYLLSFLEMLLHVLVRSYRQFVKIDAEKYYSENPRTVFKFMLWSEYVELSNKDPLHSKSKKSCAGVF